MSFSESAVEALRQALRLSPENAPLRRHLADVLAQAQRWSEAEAELREALRLDPEDAEAKLSLARALQRQRRSSEALFLLRQISSPTEPLRGRSHRLAADVLLDLGQSERAREEYRKALEADPALEDRDFAERLGSEGDPPASGPARVPVMADEQPPGVQIEPEAPTISFADVGGSWPFPL
jgi:tetratricopeptide (TPR) repeat protein